MILTKETKQNYTGIGIYKEGDRNYVGDHVGGREHGVGMYETRFIYKTPLHRYAGQFNDNKAEGIGIKLYDEGKEIYCGEYKNNERNGSGYWKLRTGATFVGEFKDHTPNGFGMIITWDGFKFIGYVRSWSAQSGKWYDQEDNEIDITEFGYNKHGSKFVGEWNGQGTFTYPDGTKYVGEFKWGIKHGRGTITYSDGRKYEGEFKDGKRNGHGTLTFSNGQKYVGEFKDGKRNGQGTFTYPDGDMYEGEWKNDEENGLGVMTYPDGHKYVGEWKNRVII